MSYAALPLLPQPESLVRCLELGGVGGAGLRALVGRRLDVLMHLEAMFRNKHVNTERTENFVCPLVHHPRQLQA